MARTKKTRMYGIYMEFARGPTGRAAAHDLACAETDARAHDIESRVCIEKLSKVDREESSPKRMALVRKCTES